MYVGTVFNPRTAHTSVEARARGEDVMSNYTHTSRTAFHFQIEKRLQVCFQLLEGDNIQG